MARTDISSGLHDPSVPTFAVGPHHSRGRRRKSESRPRESIGSPHRLQFCQPANCGDHPLIFRFLRSAAQSPTEAEFEHTQDRIDYTPQQRLLIRDRGSIVAHVRMVERELRFESSTLRSIDLTELATFSGPSQSLYRRLLVSAARQRAMEKGICLLTTATVCEEIERRPGWTSFPYGNDASLSVRHLLAGLETESGPRSNSSNGSSGASRYIVQPWRFLEKDAIRGLYETVTARSTGATVRDDEYWHWLLARHGYDRAFIALDSLAIAGKAAPNSAAIVGYIFTRGTQVVELVAHPRHPAAIGTLLRRFALDLLEKGNHSITLLAGSMSNSQEVVRDLIRSGAHVTSHPRRLATCVVSAESLIRQIEPELVQRSHEQGIKPGAAFGIVCGMEELRLDVGRNRVRITRRQRSDDRIIALPSVLSRLLLGVSDIHTELESGRITATSESVANVAGKLFTRRDITRMPFDDQPALG